MGVGDDIISPDSGVPGLGIKYDNTPSRTRGLDTSTSSLSAESNSHLVLSGDAAAYKLSKIDVHRTCNPPISRYDFFVGDATAGDKRSYLLKRLDRRFGGFVFLLLLASVFSGLLLLGAGGGLGCGSR